MSDDINSVATIAIACIVNAGQPTLATNLARAIERLKRNAPAPQAEPTPTATAEATTFYADVAFPEPPRTRIVSTRRATAKDRSELPRGYALASNQDMPTWRRRGRRFTTVRQVIADAWRDHDALTAPYRERAERAEAEAEERLQALFRACRNGGEAMAERDEARALLERCERIIRGSMAVHRLDTFGDDTIVTDLNEYENRRRITNGVAGKGSGE